MTNTENKLKKGRSNVILVGRAKVNEHTFSGETTSEKTGYKYKRINLGVEIEEGKVVYAELMGGYSPKKAVIFSQDQEGNNMEIAWADRKNEAILANVKDYKFHKAGLTRKEPKNEGEIGELITEKFLSAWDLHDYLQEHLTDGMEIVVRGQYKFSEYNGNMQKKIEIQNVFLPFVNKERDEEGNFTGKILPTKYEAKVTQTVLLTEDSLQKITKEEKEAGEFTLSALAIDYVGKKDGKEIKQNMPFTLPITVPITETTAKIAEKLFKVKRGKVRELAMELDILEGYDKQEVSKASLEIPKDIQDLIDMGLYTKEEAMKKMVVRGNKVSKLIFVRPFLKKNDEGNLIIEMSDDKYTAEDLIIAEPVEEDLGDIGTEVNASDLMGEQSVDAGDDSWLGSLGL